MSRKDRSGTRTRLLEAAVEVFGERGYEAARVHEVAHRCGFTVGAVYSRWPTKQELFVEVVEHVTRRRLASTVGDTELPAAERLALLVKNLASFSDDHLRDLMLEAAVTARRDEDLRARVSASLAAEADALSAVVAEGRTSGVIDPSLSTEAVDLLYRSLALGTPLALSTKSTDQVGSIREGWETLITRLIEAVEPSLNVEPQ